MAANRATIRLPGAGHLRPLLDKTFAFDQTLEARRTPSRAAPTAWVVITLH